MVYSNMSAASSITESIEKGSENAATFTSLVAPKKESKQKFKSLDINSIYQGKSEVPTKSVAAPKHGFQTVGKIGLARRVAPVVSTLKHSNSSSASLNSIQNNGTTSGSSASAVNSSQQNATGSNPGQVGWNKIDSENNTRNNSIECGDDVLSLDISNTVDKDFTESGPSSLSDPLQDDPLSTGCKQPSSSASTTTAPTHHRRTSSNQLDSPLLRQKDLAKDSSPRENGQQTPPQVAVQNSGNDSKNMEVSQSDGLTTQSHKSKNFLTDNIKELSSRTKPSQPIYKNDSASSYVPDNQFGSKLISDKELESLDKLEGKSCAWMADYKIDYSQKIDFSDSSDDEPEANKNQSSGREGANSNNNNNNNNRKKTFENSNAIENGKSVINRENSRRSSDSNPKQLPSNGQYSKAPSSAPFDNNANNPNSDQGRAYYGRKSDSVYEFREHDERRRHDPHYDRSSRSQQLPRNGRPIQGEDYNTYQLQPMDRPRGPPGGGPGGNGGGYRDRSDYEDNWSSGRKRMSDDFGRRPLPPRSNMDMDDGSMAKAPSRKPDIVEHKSMAPPPSIDMERDRYDRRRDRMPNEEDVRLPGPVGPASNRGGNDRYPLKSDRYATNLPPRLQRLEMQRAQEQRRIENERYERDSDRFRGGDNVGGSGGTGDNAYSRPQPELSRSGSDRNVPSRDVPDRGSWRKSNEQDKNRRSEESSSTSGAVRAQQVVEPSSAPPAKKSQDSERKDAPPPQVVEVLRKPILEHPDKPSGKPSTEQQSTAPSQQLSVTPGSDSSVGKQQQAKQPERIEVLKRPQDEQPSHATPNPSASQTSSGPTQQHGNRYPSQNESRRNDHRRNDGHHHHQTQQQPHSQNRHSSGKQPLLSEPEPIRKHQDDRHRRSNAPISSNSSAPIGTVDENKATPASTTTPAPASNVPQKSGTHDKQPQSSEDISTKSNRKNDNRNVSNQVSKASSVSGAGKPQRDRKNSSGSSHRQHFDNHDNDWDNSDRAYNHPRHKESQRHSDRSEYGKKPGPQQQREHHDSQRVHPSDRSYGNDRNHPKRKEQYDRRDQQQQHHRRDDYDYTKEDPRGYRNSGNQQRDHRQNQQQRDGSSATGQQQRQNVDHSKQNSEQLVKNMSQMSIDDVGGLNKNSRKQSSQQQQPAGHREQQHPHSRKNEQDHYDEDTRHPRGRTTSNASSNTNKSSTGKMSKKDQYNTNQQQSSTSVGQNKGRNDRNTDNKKSDNSHPKGGPSSDRQTSGKQQHSSNQSSATQQHHQQDSHANKNQASHHSNKDSVNKKAPQNKDSTSNTTTASGTAVPTRKDSRCAKLSEQHDSGIESSDQPHSTSSTCTSQRSSPNNDSDKTKDNTAKKQQTGSGVVGKKIEHTKTDKVLHNNLPESASMSRQLSENLTTSSSTAASAVETNKFKDETESLKKVTPVTSAPEPAPISCSSGTEELKAKFESVKKVWEKDAPKDDKTKLTSTSLISKPISSSVVSSKPIITTKVDVTSPSIIPMNSTTGFIAPVANSSVGLSHVGSHPVGVLSGSSTTNSSAGNTGLVSFPGGLAHTPTSPPVLPQMYSNNSLAGSGAPVTSSPYPFGTIDSLNAFNQNMHAQNAAAASMQSILPFLSGQQNPGGATAFNPMAAAMPLAMMAANQTANQFSATPANLLMAQQQLEQMNKFGMINPSGIMKNNAFPSPAAPQIGPMSHSAWQPNQSVSQTPYMNMNSNQTAQQMTAFTPGQMNRNQSNMNPVMNPRNASVDSNQSQYFRQPSILASESLSNHMAPPGSTYMNPHDPSRQQVNAVPQMGMQVRQCVQNNQFAGQGTQLNQNWSNQFPSHLLMKQMNQNTRAPFMQMFGANGGPVPPQMMAPMSNLAGNMNVNQRTTPPGSAIQMQPYGPIGRHNSGGGAGAMKNAPGVPFSNANSNVGGGNPQQQNYSGNAVNSGGGGGNRKSFNNGGNNNGRGGGRNSFYNNRNSTTPSPSGGLKNSMVDVVHSNNGNADSCASVVNSKD